MITLLHLLIAAIGLIIYFIRPNWLFMYWLIILPIIKPIMCIVAGANDQDSANSMVYGGYFMHLYIIILIDSILFKRKRFPPLHGLYAVILVLVLYLVIQAILTDGGVKYAYFNIKDVLIAVLPLLILIVNENTRPSYKHLYVMVWMLVVIETIAVFLNLIGIRFYVAAYQYFLTSRQVMMTGTFLGSQMLGNFMVTLFLFVCLDFFSRRRISFFSFSILSVLSLFCILSSGSKMCVLLSFISLLLIILFCQRKHIVYLVIVVLCGLISYNMLENYDGRDVSSNEGINRYVSGMAEFVQTRSEGLDDNSSTFSLSEKLLDEYFWKSPFIGNGLASIGNDYSYSIASGVNTVRDMRADARLAFVTVDMGLIGLFLYLLLYANLINSIKKYLPRYIRKTLRIVFVFYLLFTVTESGFWDLFCYPMVYIYYFAVIKECSSQTNETKNTLLTPRILRSNIQA